jgi:hypothetical protein
LIGPARRQAHKENGIVGFIGHAGFIKMAPYYSHVVDEIRSLQSRTDATDIASSDFENVLRLISTCRERPDGTVTH